MNLSAVRLTAPFLRCPSHFKCSEACLTLRDGCGLAPLSLHCLQALQCPALRWHHGPQVSAPTKAAQGPLNRCRRYVLTEGWGQFSHEVGFPVRESISSFLIHFFVTFKVNFNRSKPPPKADILCRPSEFSNKPGDKHLGHKASVISTAEAPSIPTA